MASAQPKNWWEEGLEWNLNSSLADTMKLGRWLRNIPSTLSAYHLGKESHVDQIEPDPVERIGSKQPPQQPKPADACARALNMPAVIEPSQPDIEEILQALELDAEAAVKAELDELSAKGATVVEERKLTLEQLLDPDFCGYVP